MSDPASLLGSETVANLIGVIDLKNGQAVHGVAGKRSRYQAVQFGFDETLYGNAIALANHYQRLGLRRLYVADLDAIEKQQPSHDLLLQIVHHCRDWDEVLLDIGWTGQNDANLAQPILDTANVSIIAATECAVSLEAIRQISTIMSVDRAVLGLDYRDGQFVSTVATQQQWFALASELGIKRCVVLDVASVGTGDCDRSVFVCQKARQGLLDATIYCGGGIRSSDDVHALSLAGCDGYLVATSLHQL